MSGKRGIVKRLCEELNLRGLLSEAEFDSLVREWEVGRESIIEAFYRLKKIKENELVEILSKILGYPVVGATDLKAASEFCSLIPKEMARKHLALAFGRDEGGVCVAISDPTNVRALDDLRAVIGVRIRPFLATPSVLMETIHQIYSIRSNSRSSSESIDSIIEDVKAQLANRQSTNSAEDLSDLLEVANATTVVRLVNHILIEGIRRKASDVFVEPLEKGMRVRYRVDGLLEEIVRAPRSFVEPVVSRIKVMSRLDIAEHRVPQDGRFKARVFGPEVDLRVSILPTCFGEKACLRILAPGTEIEKLERLGFGSRELEIIERCAAKPHGMILVTGPTGSGKTTTLYAGLQSLNSIERNITTVEDPVEYQLEGVNQVNIREPMGLTFPVALRSILRQDPDVILIGEIRDLITMDIAIKAALTGHLVLSTLHTNDATSAVVRMINMGIEPFLIASSVLMISAQRLVRRLCPICRVSYTPEREELDSLGIQAGQKTVLYKPKGCDRCRGSGYKGRIVICEIFEMKPAILDLLMKRGSNEQLRQLARRLGMRTLRESGIEKAKEGVTALEEVFRVTSPEKALEEVTV